MSHLKPISKALLGSLPALALSLSSCGGGGESGNSGSVATSNNVGTAPKTTINQGQADTVKDTSSLNTQPPSKTDSQTTPGSYTKYPTTSASEPKTPQKTPVIPPTPNAETKVNTPLLSPVDTPTSNSNKSTNISEKETSGATNNSVIASQDLVTSSKTTQSTQEPSQNAPSKIVDQKISTTDTSVKQVATTQPTQEITSKTTLPEKETATVNSSSTMIGRAEPSTKSNVDANSSTFTIVKNPSGESTKTNNSDTTGVNTGAGASGTLTSVSKGVVTSPLTRQTLLNSGSAFTDIMPFVKVNHLVSDSFEQNKANRTRRANLKNVEEIFNPVNHTSYYGSEATAAAKARTMSNDLLFSNYFGILKESRASYTTVNANYNLYPTSVDKLDGTGVKVFVIDGEFKSSNSGFQNKPTVERNFEGYSFIGKVLEEDRLPNHGTKVGLIIAGKQDQTNFGYAPNVQLGFIEIPEKKYNFQSMYQAAARHAPTVINNSYSLSNLTTERYNFTGETNYLRQLAKSETSPIFVFATGNQIMIDNKVVEERREFNPDSQLIAWATDSQLQNTILTVTGLNFKVTQVDANKYQEDLVAYNKLTPEQKSQTSAPILTMKQEYLTLAPSAIPCGETMWSCIGAYNRVVTLQGNDYFEGTSAAAPKVTATVALVKQLFPWMSNANLKTTVLTTAKDIGEPGVDKLYGWGALDIGAAVRGPGMFAFGDFIANLGSKQDNYYFSNNIYGDYGLVVSSTAADKKKLPQLILAGENTYTGDTIVSNAELTVAKQLAGRLIVNNNGFAHITRATIGSSVYNNGRLDATSATINGDYTQTANAAIFIEPTKPLQVKGTATLAGTLVLTNAQSYISATAQQYDIIKAKQLTNNSYFTHSYGISQVSYDVYYDYAHGRVFVDVYRTNLENKANRLGAALANNQERSVYNQGGSVVERFMQAMDRKTTITSSTALTSAEPITTDVADNSIAVYSANSSEQEESNVERDRQEVATFTLAAVVSSSSESTVEPLAGVAQDVVSQPNLTATQVSDEQLALALTIQNSNDDELTKLLYKASGAVYANAASAALTSNIQQQQSFTNRLSSVKPKDSFSLNTYLSANNNNQTWKANSHKLRGHFQENSVFAGAYGNVEQWLYGVNAGSAEGNWYQGYQSTDDSNTKVNAYSLQLGAGRALANDLNFVASLGFTHYNNQVARTILEDKDLIAKTSANQFRFSVNGSKNFKLSSDLSLALIAGLSLVHHKQAAFSEQVQNVTVEDFALVYKAQSNNLKFAHLGMQLDYGFNLGSLRSNLHFAVDYQRQLGNDGMYFVDANGYKTATTLDNRDILTVALSLNTSLTKALSFEVKGSYTKGKAWKTKGVNLALNYKF